MQIREAKVFNFGKLQNASFRFAPGINVIYGENEAGKSTLEAFLLGMLFGVEKNRGRAAAGDIYSRYEPWHAPSFYSGALRFSVEGRPFYLERNFYQKERSEYLRNEADGEELSVAYGDLTVLLGGIRRETYAGTCVISQSGAASGQELAGLLTEYLADASGSGAGGIRVKRALAALQNRKKELKADLRKEKETRESGTAGRKLEAELLEQDITALRQELTGVPLAECKEEPAGENEAATGGNEASVKRENPAGKGMLITVGLALVFFFCSWMLRERTSLAPAFLGAGLLAGLFALVAGIRALVETAAEKRTSEGTAQAQEAAAEAMRKAAEAAASQNRLRERLQERLREKETQLFNLQLQITEAQNPGARERELEENIQALELAAQEIQQLSGEVCADVTDELNGELSRWVSIFTNQRYDSVRVDGEGKLWVLADGKEVPPDVLSRGTLEQIYLAMRIAVGKMVTREEKMPFFLDEAFAMYDDRRLAGALAGLSRLEEQILIFTCQHREEAVLEQLGIPYHRITL